MTLRSFVKYGIIALFKGIAACIAGFIGITLSGAAAKLLGIATPVLPVKVDSNVIFIFYMVVWLLTSIIIGELFKKIGQKFLERFLCIFLFNYLIQNFLQTLEQIIFTNTTTLKFGIIFYFFPSLFISLAAALLWKPAHNNNSIIKELPEFFRKRDVKSWLWRITAAWLIYLPIYYGVGASISPIVKSYYQDPSLALGLVLPDWKVIAGMQILRGIFFLLAVFPVIILWKKKETALWVWLGLAIFIQVATLMLLSYWLPPVLRVTHACELTIDSFLQAFIYVKLLYPGDKTEFSKTKDIYLT